MEDLRNVARDWLYDEAWLMDSGRWREWLELLTDDVRYRVPVRLDRLQEPGFSQQMALFDEDRASLSLRVERYYTEYAWAERPPSRTRHFISNVRLIGGGPDELRVRSYVWVVRSRGEEAGWEQLAGERYDRLRQVGNGWKMAEREFCIDQSTLGSKNLSFLL